MVGFYLVNRAGVRRYLGGFQVSPEAVHVLERDVAGHLAYARRVAEDAGRRRIGGIEMRRGVRHLG